MRRILFISVCLAMLTVACGSTSGSTQADRSGPAGRSADGSIPISTTTASQGSAKVIARVDGGTIATELPDGTTATLTIPAGALDSDTLVTLVPLNSPEGVGVAIEPAGTWLDALAMLRLDRAGTVLVRSAPAPEADRFVPIGAAPTAIPIARFRPILVSTSIPAPTTRRGGEPPAPVEWTQTIQPLLPRGDDPKVDDPDPYDEVAKEIEESEDGAESTDTHGADIRRAAAATADALATQCDDRTSPAAARIADTLTTAGSVATPPTCVRRVVQMVANLEGSFSGDGASVEIQSTLVGHGVFVATVEGASLSFPLEGVETGLEKFASYGATTMVWGLSMLANVGAPDPNAESCSISPLVDGGVVGSAQLIDGATIRFSLTPSGSYTIACPGFPEISLAPFVLSMLPELGLANPITVDLPDSRNAVRGLGQMVDVADLGVRTAPDGSVSVSESGMTISMSFSVGVFWSRADRCQLTPEEQDREAELCGTGPS